MFLFLFLTSINIFASNIPDRCHIHFLWGHTQGVTEALDLAKSVKSAVHFVPQACELKKQISVPGYISQYSWNGLGDGELQPASNGGMNPRMSKGAAEVDKKRDSYKDNSLYLEAFEKVEATYLKPYYESAMSRSYVQDEARVRSRDVIDIARGEVHKEVNSVGFMRLSAFNWFASLAKARQLLAESEASKKCESVKIQFKCVDMQTTDGSVNLNTKEWLRRLSTAENTHLFSERENGSIAFRSKQCGLDRESRPIMNTPMNCGEEHVVDRNAFRSIDSGLCGSQILEAGEMKSDDPQLKIISETLVPSASGLR